MGLLHPLLYAGLSRRFRPVPNAALYDEGMSRKTFRQYRNNLWLLGGTIIRKVSWDEEYQDDPLEKLAESVADNGILPDHYDQMTQAELRAFERMCRRFEKYLGESIGRTGRDHV